MKRSLFLISMLSLFILSACIGAKTHTLEEFYQDAKIEKVEKVIIQDGSTGISKVITVQEQIDTFLSLIKDIEFSPEANQEKRKGWQYAITLFDGKEEFKFTLNEIGDTYYNSNPDIYPIVETFYKQ